jgi:hypothetical protein
MSIIEQIVRFLAGLAGMVIAAIGAVMISLTATSEGILIAVPVIATCAIAFIRAAFLIGSDMIAAMVEIAAEMDS